MRLRMAAMYPCFRSVKSQDFYHLAMLYHWILRVSSVGPETWALRSHSSYLFEQGKILCSIR